MYITITGGELSPENHLSDEFLNKVLELFEANPVGEFERLVTENNQTKPYSRELCLSLLKNSTAAQDRGFRATDGDDSEKLWFWGSVSFDNSRYNVINMEFGDYYFKKQSCLSGEMKNYARQWSNVFPSFIQTHVSADDRENEFWMDIAKIEPLPDCFGMRLGWYHVISPQGYKPYFKREDLLNAPAYEIEELEDGTVCLTAYEHPLHFADEQITRQIIGLTQYLTEKWYEHDPVY